ncbi:RidA family protein [Arthrobacter sp. MI7-26]|uniref:RidA family protein n=1 Tax=Arthrobacter sp. MI7-26 TaxID=2993653 RepID=UPI002248AB0B|nr:RidA family protein [Arthrobacter sp. MI7-26]MCX2750034.1 RidA family protein [Arthrobacter sp. MI7-26]
MSSRLVRVPAPVVPGISDSVLDLQSNLLYVSGVYVPDPEDMERSMRLTFGALEEALHRGGTTFSSLVRVNVFIKHLDEEKLQTYRRVRDAVIDTKNLPASTVVGVHSLYNNAVLEIDAIATVEPQAASILAAKHRQV